MVTEFEKSAKSKICCHCKRITKWNNNKKNCPECLIRKQKQYDPKKAKKKREKIQKKKKFKRLRKLCPISEQ